MQATAAEQHLAETIAFWHGQRMMVQHPRLGMMTYAATRGYSSGARGAQDYARERWQEYLQAARATIEHFALGTDNVGWRAPSIAPRDGRSIEILATLTVHHIAGANFSPLPAGWRPDTPQSEWRLQGWREPPEPDTGVAAVPAESDRGNGGNVTST